MAVASHLGRAFARRIPLKLVHNAKSQRFLHFNSILRGNMSRIAIFGSSYITRLERFCDGDMGVPGTVRFFGKGGMRLDNLPEDIIAQLIDFKPDVVFFHLDGNDIRHNSFPRHIFENMVHLVHRLKNSGVRDVFVGEILTRGNFSKAPGLDHFRFEKQTGSQQLVEQRKKFGKFLFRFPKYRFPKDFLPDRVHLNNMGLIRYMFQIKSLLCSIKGH